MINFNEVNRDFFSISFGILGASGVGYLGCRIVRELASCGNERIAAIFQCILGSNIGFYAVALVGSYLGYRATRCLVGYLNKHIGNDLEKKAHSEIPQWQKILTKAIDDFISKEEAEKSKSCLSKMVLKLTENPNKVGYFDDVIHMLKDIAQAFEVDGLTTISDVRKKDILQQILEAAEEGTCDAAAYNIVLQQHQVFVEPDQMDARIPYYAKNTLDAALIEMQAILENNRRSDETVGVHLNVLNPVRLLFSKEFSFESKTINAAKEDTYISYWTSWLKRNGYSEEVLWTLFLREYNEKNLVAAVTDKVNLSYNLGLRTHLLEMLANKEEQETQDDSQDYSLIALNKYTFKTENGDVHFTEDAVLHFLSKELAVIQKLHQKYNVSLSLLQDDPEAFWLQAQPPKKKLTSLITQNSNGIQQLKFLKQEGFKFSSSASFYSYCAEGVDDSGWGCAWRAIQTCLSAFQKDVPSFQDLYNRFGSGRNLRSLYRNFSKKDIKERSSFAPHDLSSGWAEPFIGQVAFHAYGHKSSLVAINGIPSYCHSPHEVFSTPIDFGKFTEQLVVHFDKENPPPVMIDDGIVAMNIVGVKREGDKLSLCIADPHLKKIGHKNRSEMTGIYFVEFDKDGNRTFLSLSEEDKKLFSHPGYSRVYFNKSWMALFPS